MDSTARAVVLDIGSGLTKAGFAGQDAPHVVFPSMLSRPKQHLSAEEAAGLERFYVGEGPGLAGPLLTHSYPVEGGIWANWSDIERLLRHVFEAELRVHPAAQPVLLAETPFNPKRNRERMAELMFETFGIPALHLACSSLLAMQAAARPTGLVVDVGECVCHILPVLEGVAVPGLLSRRDVAGVHVTEYLHLLLRRRTSSLSTRWKELQALNRFKETACFVAKSADERDRLIRTEEVEQRVCCLPDETALGVGCERFLAPECLFDPCSTLGKSMDPLGDIVLRIIMDLEAALRSTVGQNVVLCGGSTLLPGFAERLQWECLRTAPLSVDVTVSALPAREFLGWLGGSIVAAGPFPWVLREEYLDAGPSALL